MAKKIDAECQNNPHVQQGVVDQKYRVLDYVGGGGTACVYTVRTEDDPHVYALKLLQDKYFQNDFVLNQFRLEGDRLLQLNHPNIVRFYDLIIQQQFAYLLMEYVSGYSLSELIKFVRRNNQQFPLDEAMRILVQASRAVRYLHENDLVHRDIKAGNILIDQESGKVYLVDFGIATDIKDNLTFNAGTRAYMPPEQLEDIGIQVSFAADVYAFGIVAYEVLVGRRPFTRNRNLDRPEAEKEIIRQHREAPVPPISELRPELPASLNPVFERALAKHPNDRYPDIQTFIEELHSTLLPYLSADLKVLNNITHKGARSGEVFKSISAEGGARSITNIPSVERAEPADNPWLLRGVIVVALMLLAVGGGIVFFALQSTDDSPQEAVVTETLTPTIPTETPTETTTETPTDAPEVAQLPSDEATEPSEGDEDDPLEGATDADQTSEPTAENPLSATDTPEPTQTVTPTYTPSLTPTVPTNTPTTTPEPLICFQDQVFLYVYEDTEAFGLSGNLTQAVEVVSSETEGLVPLNIGNLQDFRLELSLTNFQNVNRYGVAYGLSDDLSSYQLFSISPNDGGWQIATVNGETSTVQTSGTFPSGAPQNLITMAVGGTFCAETGDPIVENSASLSGGRLALWFDMANDTAPPISRIEVGAMGDKAIQLATASPTPAQYVQVQNFLLQDVEAILATGDRARVTISCTDYMPLYESLDRHLQREEPTATFAQQAISAGQFIYNRCDFERPFDGILTLLDSQSDYQTWESNFINLRSEIEQAN